MSSVQCIYCHGETLPGVHFVTPNGPVCRQCYLAPDPRQPPNPIDHPPHYTFGKHEVIDIIEDWQLNFHLGNAVKYIARAGRKGDALEDLRKAAWYLDREIKRRGGT